MITRYWPFGPHAGINSLMRGIGDAWRDLNSQGIPAFIKSADDYGSCLELLQIGDDYGVENTAVFRLSEKDGIIFDVPNWFAPSPQEAAQQHVDLTLAYLPPEFDKRTWLEIINEPDKDVDDNFPGWGSAEFSEWLGQFMVHAANLLLAKGYRVAGFGYSSGEPELDDWTQPAMLNFIGLAATHPDVAIAVHEYSYDENTLESGDGFLIGRFQKIFDVADSYGLGRPKILVTEFGWTLWHIPPPEVAIPQLIKVADELYGPHPEILGAGIWYFGNGWQGIQSKANELIWPMHGVAREWRMEVEPEEPPMGTHRAVVVKIPQEWNAYMRGEFSETSFVNQYKRTVTPSHDDAITMYRGGSPETSEIQVVDPWQPSQVEAIQRFKSLGLRYTEHYFEESPAPPPPIEPPPPPPGEAIDLKPYFAPESGSRGPIYELRRPDGSQERVQHQTDNGFLYITKGTGGKDGKSEWEELEIDNQYIWRGLDTSPGGGRFYIQYEPGKRLARWCKRFMRIGELYTGVGHRVQFYFKDNCSQSPDNSGGAVNQTQLFSRGPKSVNGFSFDDVIHLGKQGGEEFWFARGIGMIGWKSQWGESWISELHGPGQRPDNVKEPLCKFTLP